MADRLKLWIAGNDSCAQLHGRACGKSVCQREFVLRLQAGGLPDDFRSCGHYLNGQGFHLGGDGLCLVIPGPSESEIIDFRQVDLMEQELFSGLLGLEQEILNRLSALFVLKPGHDGE